MSNFGSILVADDEKLFRESTRRILRKEGFHCKCVADSEEALSELQKKHYDVLLSDIKMPGNGDLQFVRKAMDLYRGMSVILITGYPSTETTIQSVELPIVAYLTKPLKPNELLRHVMVALDLSIQRRAITATIEHLRSAILDLETCRSRPLPRDPEVGLTPVETARTIVLGLSQLLELPSTSENIRRMPNLCELLECSKKSTYRSAVVETVEVLRTTKHLFKSKVLAELRTKLEAVLES